MMKKWLLFLCIPFVLKAASFYELGAGAGYRQDHLECTMFNDLGLTIVDEDFHKLRSIELEGYFKGIYKFLYLYGHADYAWVQSGELDLNPYLNPGIPTGGSANTVPFEFHNKVRHKLYDVDGCIGLNIPLWEKENNQRGFLIFFGGYSLHRQVLTLGTPDPIRDNNTNIAAAFPLFSLSSFSWDQSVGKTNWTWWGSFVGANLDIKPLDCLEFEVAYSFHPMKMELRFDAATSNQLFISKFA